MDGEFISAVYAGEDEVCNLGHEKARGWWCSSHGPGPCAHLLALQLVTKRPVDLAAVGPPLGPELGIQPPLEASTRMAGTEPEPLETAHYEPARRRRLLPWMIALVVLTAATGVVLALVLRQDGSPAPNVTTPPPATPIAPTGSAWWSASPPLVPAAISTFPEAASGEVLTLAVTELPTSDVTCLTHSFDGEPAYQSECRSWPNDLYWFYVVLRNRGTRPVSFSLEGFRITDRNGQTQEVVDVREKAGDPEHFLPGTATIGGRESLVGWLAVRAGPDFVPVRLVYPEGQQVLAVEFTGTHHITPRA
jgi:hypothetical protein